MRLQGDERLIALIRRGHHGAFEALVQRYQSRLLAFCRHMLGSTEDAEDVLQEVFTAAFNAICADERPINARPWLYRIARNRCLNHLRRPSAHGQDTMDIFERDGGTTTAETVHKREEFRQIVADVQHLPETQKTALLLREIDALSYEQIAEAMDTTVPSVKSLLVRARVSLAEAAEARLLTCDEVRDELGQVAEGLAKTSAPVRRHLKGCERCRVFRSELRRANRALAAVYPLGPLVVLKKAFVGKLGGGAAASSGGAAAGGVGAGATAGGLFSAGATTIASKAAAGFAAVAIVTAGAAEVKRVAESRSNEAASPVTAIVPAPPRDESVGAAGIARAVAAPVGEATAPAAELAEPSAAEEEAPEAATVTEASEEPAPTATTAGEATTTDGSGNSSSTTTTAPANTTQEESSTVVLGEEGASGEDGSTGGPTSPPGEASDTPAEPQPAPIAGDPRGGHRP